MDEDEKISTLASLTNLTTDQCVELLRHHGGNLELAVSSYVPDSQAHLAEQFPRIPPEASEPIRIPPDNLRPPPVDPVSNSPPLSEPGFVSSFKRVARGAAVMAASFLGSLLNPGSPGSGGIPRGPDPVQSFEQQYRAKYGNSVPAFFHGSYREAVDRSKSVNRLLLVYLHNDMHHSTPQFCREVLGSPPVIAFINAHFIMWAGSMLSPEPFSVSQSLNVTGYPFLGILGFVSNKLVLIDRLEGVMSEEALMARLTNAKEAYLAQQAVQRAEREMQDSSRQIRQEQDRAYQQSLLDDQRREREAAEARRREQEERERLEMEEAARLSAEEALRQARAAKRRSLPAEPAADDDKGAIASVNIRLPDGRRLQRRFPAGTPLSAVVDFIEGEADFDMQAAKLVTNFPRKIMTDHSSPLGAESHTFFVEL
eukprot:gnl/Hemi2/17007_TR5647_c0_g1_i1.p1 gnl/Hemi2/17007_TR5647_c0_g1~~gnl/Hemi2/17007_TR5647_c0_g1_i1.p1  ORF type:complete len:426 (+),score=114.04 gnl/Hemi2/17007_TR5647_c0_g1_i1:172-1449(+)